MDEDSSTEQNMAGLQFWDDFFFRLHFNESREGFCRRGRGRSFHVDGPKTEKAWFNLKLRFTTMTWKQEQNNRAMT